MTLVLSIARRYLFVRGSALSYVGRLAFAGLVLSVAVLVIVLSVVNGFERELRERLLAVLPQVVLSDPEGIELSEAARLREPPAISGLLGLAPFVEGTVLLSANGEVRAAQLTGIDVDSYGAVSDLARFVRGIEGEAGAGLGVLEQDRFTLILGATLAADLGLAIGDSVVAVQPAGRMTPVGLVPRQKRFKVAATFATESQLDRNTAYMRLVDAQVFFRTGSRVHGMQGRLVELFEFSNAAKYLRSQVRSDSIRIRSWMSTYGSFYQAIAVQKVTMFVLLSFLVGVAAFNLVSGLVMIVEQRKNDIAVLRTLGAQSSTLIAVFIVLGVVVATFGILVGLLVGSAIANALPELFAWINTRFDLGLMTQYFISYLPVDVRIMDLVQVGGASLLLAVLATLYPAWRASRLLPSRVLAQE